MEQLQSSGINDVSTKSPFGSPVLPTFPLPSKTLTETTTTTTTTAPVQTVLPSTPSDKIMAGVKQMLANETSGGDGWWAGWELVKQGYYRK